ncbi:hypothetical protein AGOR_G00231210 [Albula goreensis]|uniref:Uncharacterized protein n=1 Tax=Albula goreensis TaxID=1534307 RepID=A0A8T3CFQ6_9TELE|nr:hypothetical protein AGOR_G00231210 [Albula goreensis]
MMFLSVFCEVCADCTDSIFVLSFSVFRGVKCQCCYVVIVSVTVLTVLLFPPVFCEACRETHGLYAQVKGLLPVRVASYMLLPYTLPVESAYSITQRLVEWVPEVPADVRWLCGVAGAVCNQVWRGAGAESTSEVPLRKCLSVPPVTDLSGTGRGVVRDGVGPLQLSCMDLPSSFWNAPNSSDPSILHRLKTPSPSPKQVCFFVGSTDDSDPEHCQEYQDPVPQVVEELQDG